MDKVSIIVPVYKVAPYLVRCIESLVKQTYSSLEIVLIDDASPDNSKEIINNYAKKDNRIIPIFQKENKGVSAARNQALDIITGNWVCFCDGDDWYELDFVEKMLMCAQRTKADYVICNYKIVSDYKPALISNSIDSLKIDCNPRKVIACGPTSSCTHMLRKSLFDIAGVRYPEECRQNEELPVIPVLAKYAQNISILDEPLYNYYQRGDGSSASNVSLDYEQNFLRAWKIMRDKLGDEYSCELQYHAIYALLYGLIMQMCKQGVSSSSIKKKIMEIEGSLDDCWNNIYMRNLGILKRIFFLFERIRFIWGLRVLSWIHSKIVN